MRPLAHWLLAMPVPDPELQCEIIGWAMILLCVADVMTWWPSAWIHGHSMRF
jgi:hypothetical protein